MGRRRRGVRVGRGRAALLAGLAVPLVAGLAGCDDGVERAGPSVAVRPLPVAPPGPIAPPGRQWVVVPTAATSPTPSSSPRTPSATPTPTTPVPTTPLPTTPVPTTPVPAGPCLPRYGMGVTIPVDVATGTRSVTMTWWHNGDPATVAYWVGVEPQLWVRPTNPGDLLQSAPITWTTVPPPQGCRPLSYLVPGLRRGVSYTLWLEVQASLPESPAGFARTTLNRIPRVRLA